LEGIEGRLGRKAKTAIASAKGAGVITAIDIGVAGVSSVAVAAGFLPVLGLVMLIESAGLMLLGGALSFSGQPGIRRITSALTRTDVSKSDLEDVEAKAATYALVGVLLFLESLVLAAATM
jgi:hypothetical protein